MSPPLPKPFPSPGTSSTAMPGRWPGGWPRRGPVRGDRLHHPRRPRAGGDRRARARLRLIESVCIASYHDYTNQGELQVLKDIAPAIKALGDGSGKGVLVVDDLTDTGKTAKIVRDMLPNAHFADRLRQAGRPADDRYLRDRGEPGHLDLFPLGYGPDLSGPDQGGCCRLEPFPIRHESALVFVSAAFSTVNRVHFT